MSTVYTSERSRGSVNILPFILAPIGLGLCLIGVYLLVTIAFEVKAVLDSPDDVKFIQQYMGGMEFGETVWTETRKQTSGDVTTTSTVSHTVSKDFLRILYFLFGAIILMIMIGLIKGITLTGAKILSVAFIQPSKHEN